MDDTAIIEMYFCRDQQAIAETDKKYGALCRSISSRIVGDERDCEECVNDSYLKVWNSVPPNRPSSLCAYLGRIVRNLSLDLFRKKNAAKRAEKDALCFEELSECIPDRPLGEAEDPALKDCLNNWLKALTKEQRIYFLRRYWLGEPLSDISLKYGISPNSLSVTLHRLRKSLKRALEQGGFSV